MQTLPKVHKSNKPAQVDPIAYNRQLPSPGIYARSWKALLTMPADMEVRVPGYIVGRDGWGSQIATAGEVLRRVQAAAQNRINARAGIEPMESRETDVSLRRDSIRIREIQTRRLRVYQFETREARRRFSHLLADRSED